MKEKETSAGTNYLKNMKALFSYYKQLGEKALSQVGDKDISWRPDPESNSLAVIAKHISGNMLSRWTDFFTSDGEKPWRNRDGEFIDDIKNKNDLLERWEKGWSCLLNTFSGIKEEDLSRTVTIRNKSHTVIEAINRHLCHYAFHIGQLVYAAKSRRSSEWQSLSIPKGKSEDYNKSRISKKT